MNPKISIVVEKDFKEEIEKCALENGYLNASDLCRDAIRDKVKELENREAIFNRKVRAKQGAVTG